MQVPRNNCTDKNVLVPHGDHNTPESRYLRICRQKRPRKANGNLFATSGDKQVKKRRSISTSEGKEETKGTSDVIATVIKTRKEISARCSVRINNFSGLIGIHFDTERKRLSDNGLTDSDFDGNEIGEESEEIYDDISDGARYILGETSRDVKEENESGESGYENDELNVDKNY